MSKKSNFLEIKARIDRESFWAFYRYHNLNKTAEYFEITRSNVERLAKEYNLIKSPEDIKKTSELTCLEKYGVSNGAQTLESKNKIRNKCTNLNRIANMKSTKQQQYLDSIAHINLDELKYLYLTENWSYEDIKQKYNISGYKLDKILKSNNISKSRTQSSSLVLKTKYTESGGKDSYFENINRKRLETIIARYDSLENFSLIISEKCKNTWNLKSKEEINSLINNLREKYYSNPDKIDHAKEVRIQTNLERYGVDNSYKLATYTSSSQPNSNFYNLLQTFGFKVEGEIYLSSFLEGKKGYRFDFQIDNILLELNPWPFHNTSWNPIPESNPISKSYHFNKTKCAREHGYRCIHIWDWDDQEKIVKSLLPKTPIYARKCEIREVSKDICDEFLNKYHFQNSCRGQTIRYGLYFNDELIQIMTFGKPRYNKNYDYELLRLCTNNEYNVIGGSKKLFSHFLKNYPNNSIISYCDNSKFLGDVYSSIGMILKDKGKPTCHWYHPKLDIHITDNFLRQRGFDQLFGDIFGTYGKGTSNEELMIQHGFVPIYDCGQSSYIWNK